MNSRAIFAATFFFFLASCGEVNVPTTTDEQIVCAQDAMQCSDGSWVARSTPKCDFVCPESTPK